MKIKIRTPFDCPSCKTIREYYFDTDELKKLPIPKLRNLHSKIAYTIFSNNGCAPLLLEIEEYK